MNNILPTSTSLDWSQIDTVLLDMDGTLLDLHFDSYFWLSHLPRVLASKRNVSNDDAMDVLRPIFEEYARTLNWYCVNFWSAQLDLDIMQHKREVAHNIGYLPGAKEFLHACQAQCDDVRMITNGHRKVLDLKIEYTDIDQFFDQLICSHELDFPKENIAFWDRLQQSQAYDPDRTLFIDDNDYVLEVAHQYGIKHIYSIAEPDSSKQRADASQFPMITDLSLII